jgi:hypothetical protein
VEEGRARIESSACAKKLCVERGWIAEAGEFALCIPNRVGVFARGESGVDAVCR